MGLKTTFLARLILIALIAFATGPRPAVAMGDGVVICGADGVLRTVIYDFEAGAPAAPAKGFHTCDDCVPFAALQPPEPVSVLGAAFLELVLLSEGFAPVHRDRLSPGHPVRAPPRSVTT